MTVSNAELRKRAQSALDHWVLDEETDSQGNVRRGLEFLADDGDWDHQEVIDCNVQSTEDWDGLEEWAERLGTMPNFVGTDQ